MSIKSKLQHIIKTSLPIDIPDNRIIIEDSNNGYYTSDVALVLSDELKKEPKDIANSISDNINSNIIEKVEVLDSGIINIFISKKYLFNNINKIISDGKNYGRSNYGNNKKINIHYGSLDFSNKLSFNNIRTFIYGDCLSRIMSFAGYDITRDFYIKEGNNDLLLNYIKKELDKIRVSFDIYTREDDLFNNGVIDTVLSKLQRSGKCYITDDNLWLKTSSLYDNKDRMLIRSDGNYTYALPLISYYVSRLNKEYDKIIDMFTKEDNDYDGLIKSSLEILGYDLDKIILRTVEDINLVNNDDYSIEDIINNISVNAIRYFLISKRFDTEISMEKTEDISNPIYYIEQVNVKLSSLIRGKNYKVDIINDTTYNKDAYIILNKLMEFEEVVIRASIRGIPYIISNYLYELCHLTDNYLNIEKEVNDAKLLILSAIYIVINNAANIIGLILREDL